LRYIDAVEIITGEPFSPNLDPNPVARIAHALGLKQA
jgi:hypothetical protein